MAGTGKNVIFASRGSSDSSQKNPHVAEAIGSVAITPGQLVVKDAAGEFELAVAGLNELVYVADLNAIGQTGVDEDWTAGDTVVSFLPRDGEKFNIRMDSAQALEKDTPLKASAAGQMAIGIPGTDDILFYSDEVVGSTSAGQLVRALKAR